MRQLWRRVSGSTGGVALGAMTGVLALAAIGYFIHRLPTSTSAVVAAQEQDASVVDDARIAWCAEGLQPIAGGGCFAAATKPASPPRLLVYLHGMYAPQYAGEELDRQSRVAKAATALGFSVVALRGHQGQCARPEVADYWCWPSNDRSADAGPAYVDAWSTALASADGDAGRGKRYLLGFSNGGYFAALIAARSLMTLDGVAVAHAGIVEPFLSSAPKTPLLLLTADGDPSVFGMMQLDNDLSAAKWPHAIVTRDGGHQLTDGDITFALTFFLRAEHEPLPLTPPLSLRLPIPDVQDAALPMDELAPVATAALEDAGAPSKHAPDDDVDE